MNTNTPQEEMTLEKVASELDYILKQYSYCARERKAISSALQHLETLKRDKERLDWLEDCGEWFVNVTNEIESDDAPQWSVLKWESDDIERRGKAETLRAAIDSAMAQTIQQKGEG